MLSSSGSNRKSVTNLQLTYITKTEMLVFKTRTSGTVPSAIFVVNGVKFRIKRLGTWTVSKR